MTRRAALCAAVGVALAPTASAHTSPCPAPAPLVQADEVLHIALSRDALLSVREQAEEWVTMSQGEIAGDGDWLISVLLHGRTGITRPQLIAEVERFLEVLYSSEPLTDEDGEDTYPATVLSLNGGKVLGHEYWK